jgi:serine/threonine-protein kinase
LWWQFADGSGAAERLPQGAFGVPKAWSPDGQVLAFQSSGAGTQRDIVLFRLSEGKVEPYLQTPFNEGAPQFSPDGRCLAYMSYESGRAEIYVQPFPKPGGKWQVSTEGGTEPVWARNGELFYRSGAKMMAVEVTTRSTFSAGKPKMLWERQYQASPGGNTGPAYDVSPDGQRFLMARQGEPAPAPPINVVVNWVEDMRRRAPAGKQ